MSNTPRLYAYVDETGDRGTSASSSKFFAMAAIVIPSEDVAAMRAIVDTCRAQFGLQPGRPLHWVRHIRPYARRQYTASLLAAMPSLTVNYVIIEKTAIPAASAMRGDHTLFYNHVAGLVMERLLLTAKTWPGGPREIDVRFGHVRGFRHAETITHFEAKAKTDPTWVPWSLLGRQVEFVQMGKYEGLEVADLYAGMLDVAITPDRLGGYEEHHFLRIRHQIRRHRGRCWGAGFKILAEPGTLPGMPWWPGLF